MRRGVRFEACAVAGAPCLPHRKCKTARICSGAPVPPQLACTAFTSKRSWRFLHVCRAEDISSCLELTEESIQETTPLIGSYDNAVSVADRWAYWNTETQGGELDTSVHVSAPAILRSALQAAAASTALQPVPLLQPPVHLVQPNAHDVTTTSQPASLSSPSTSGLPSSTGIQSEPTQSLPMSLRLWALLMLAMAYIHQSATGFAIPAMLPMLSSDLQLSDMEGALLTSGYSYLYAVALIPVGLLADKVSRPALLAAGLALWSGLTFQMSTSANFMELMATRVGFAAAQATQNPISFSLIPDLFPANKSTAMAVYNCAIYVGRAVSFGAAMLAQHLGLAQHDAICGLHMIPIDQLDLHTMSIVYTRGEMVMVSSIYDYGADMAAAAATAAAALAEPSSWRRLLWWLGLPGLGIAALMLVSVVEPRSVSHSKDGTSVTRKADWRGAPARLGKALGLIPHSSSAHPPSAQRGSNLASQGSAPAEASGWRGAIARLGQRLGLALSTSSPASQQANCDVATTSQQQQGGLMKLLKMPSFQAVTVAAALNDVANYSLVAWQAVFYQRIFQLDAEHYGPILAAIVPLGGIVGGVGGGYLADRLEQRGSRAWVTVGASLLAAPAMAASLLAPTPSASYLFLLLGFALSEAWRAPGAVMIRSIAPAGAGSSASAAYLCVRNFIGGLGPLAVAQLSGPLGLRHALMLIPACYVLSAAMFAVAEGAVKEEHRRQAAEVVADAPALVSAETTTR